MSHATPRTDAIRRWLEDHAAEIEATPFGSVAFHWSPGGLVINPQRTERIDVPACLPERSRVT
jgi:hypothetical protein